MAQAATMGPPLSPRETRRSGRRSLPSASTSASKSPDSDTQKEANRHTNSGRQKRLKQEDLEDAVDDRKNGPAPSTSSTSSTNAGRTKRKKDKQVAPETMSPADTVDSAQNPPLDAAEDEEQGITRCVCGSTGEPFKSYIS